MSSTASVSQRRDRSNVIDFENRMIPKNGEGAGTDTRDHDGWSKTPHWLFREMPQMTGGVLKITLYVCRQTRGWHREWDCISYSQFSEATGLSKQSVYDNVNAALEAGYICRRPAANSYEYALCEPETVKKVDHSSEETVKKVDRSDTKMVKKVDHSDQSETGNGQESRPETVKKVDHSSEETVKKVDPQKKVNVLKKPKETLNGGSAKPEPPDSAGRDHYFEGMCHILGWDWKVITEKQRGQLNQTIGILKEAGYKVDDLRRFYQWWFKTHWKGKRGEHPDNPAEIRKNIAKIRDSVPQFGPDTGKRRNLTPADRPPVLDSF